MESSHFILLGVIVYVAIVVIVVTDVDDVDSRELVIGGVGATSQTGFRCK